MHVCLRTIESAEQHVTVVVRTATSPHGGSAETGYSLIACRCEWLSVFVCWHCDELVTCPDVNPRQLG